jgi:hypothetical protein
MKMSQMYAVHMASMLKLEATRLEEQMAHTLAHDPNGGWSLDVDPVSIAGSRHTAELFSQWVGKTPKEKEALYEEYRDRILTRFVPHFRMDLRASLEEEQSQNAAA